MKRYVYIIFLLASSSLQAQRIPSFGLNKVRITAPGRTIVTEITPSAVSSLHSDRIYYWYGGNTIHNTQGGYSGKLLHGKYEEYYTDKSLKEQGEFDSGLKDGLWRSWQESGALAELVNWQHGIKEGDFTFYDEQGQPRQSGRYADNLLEGKVLIYHGGDSVETVRYKHGQIVSNTLKTPSLWQKVKAIHWLHKRDSIQSTTATPPAVKPKKIKKQKNEASKVNAS
ncbi:hypothetical protein KHS38_00035 [Mucilaginibacter sp. Bleaf8]|uniref:toxin-antitoxin system YwqK family antitoxin n=1 Tax=Mucilaginibacter sp. Bleaf8 TaxID=2834430 RepID=UPI001BCF4DCE|nr:hypothetical protein [Mucilaginibacter sp. Bleaf8]MBS7562779.1 hypothetical protein [Mucilaginibacter sp. Bleaf8]